MGKKIASNIYFNFCFHGAIRMIIESICSNIIIAVFVLSVVLCKRSSFTNYASFGVLYNTQRYDVSNYLLVPRYEFYVSARKYIAWE